MNMLGMRQIRILFFHCTVTSLYFYDFGLNICSVRTQVLSLDSERVFHRLALFYFFMSKFLDFLTSSFFL